MSIILFIDQTWGIFFSIRTLLKTNLDKLPFPAVIYSLQLPSAPDAFYLYNLLIASLTSGSRINTVSKFCLPLEERVVFKVGVVILLL